MQSKHRYHQREEVTLEGLSKQLDFILENQEILMATIVELQAAVQRNTDAEDSVVQLLKGISQQLKDAKASGNPAELDKVISQLDANTAKLASAVVENTPAA